MKKGIGLSSVCVEIVREVEGQSRRLDMLAAEGIEEQPVGSRLAAMGCTYAQGHHYARPLTKADFLDWSGAPAPA
jgi:EAL domain-containing protein (putative c-di-GMP-specific phosphodiesterase class I)